MRSDPLLALSPLDGRYQRKLAALGQYFSEYALIKHRFQVEIAWFVALAAHPEITEIPPLSAAQRAQLHGWLADFSAEDATAIKAIERETNHDVKAVEYFLKRKLAATPLASYQEFVHFACTSADINNVAYALMLQGGLTAVWLPAAGDLLAVMQQLASGFAHQPMLARTHGQPASPTTLGKELAVFAHRLQRQLNTLQGLPHLAKMNGAVGNFNAHHLAYPHVDWPAFSQNFLAGLGLHHNPLTTQIESHDGLAEILQAIIRFNTIGLDFARDIWLYIANGYFEQKLKAGEVGSSTMPHKVNPIDFENAEGNFGLSNALLQFLVTKLPVSRWQRDLSDSTVMRNLGVALGYSLLAITSLRGGVDKLQVVPQALNADLDAHWVVLAEAVQTMMRQAGMENPYEQLKALTRGKTLTPAEFRDFVITLPLTAEAQERLLALSPATYIGLAHKLAVEL